MPSLDGLARRLAGWVYRHGVGELEHDVAVADERRATVREVREEITAAMALVDTDRQGHSMAGKATNEARQHGTRALGLVQEVDDRVLRDRVETWRNILEATPPGWEREGGATPEEWAKLDGAAQDATRRAGEVYRELAGPRPT